MNGPAVKIATAKVEYFSFRQINLKKIAKNFVIVYKSIFKILRDIVQNAL